MRVLVANNRTKRAHEMAKRLGNMGHLYSPGYQRAQTYEHLPYALDNGRFIAWKNKAEWDRVAYTKLLQWAFEVDRSPLWALVPDVVADKEGTLEEWQYWYPRLRGFPWPIAFAVQDGMEPEDVPSTAQVIFIGGSTEFKMKAIRPFCEAFPRVHVGRVNTLKRLIYCYRAGVESVDGTSWFIAPEKWRDLERFLVAQNNNNILPQEVLAL
jgi:hypothetical protein